MECEVDCRQGRNATCPMCSATVELSVQWRLPWRHNEEDAALALPAADDEGPDPQAAPDGGAPHPQAAGLFPEIQVIGKQCGPMQ